MKILITGTGFLSKEIESRLLLNKNNTVEVIGRAQLNLVDALAVSGFFSEREYDAVIHTSVSGGKRNKEDNYSTLIDNIAMFNNLAANDNRFKMLITFGSGAEYDRSENISSPYKGSIFSRTPKDYYGLSKLFITSRMRDLNQYKECTYINLRIFNTFGAFEESRRFIKASIDNCVAGRDISINQNKFMDFVYVEDLYKVIDFALNNKVNPRFFEMDIVYEEKNTLLSIAEKIKGIGGFENDIIIEAPDFSLSYVGDSTLFYEFVTQNNIALDGLEGGISTMIKGAK